MKTKTTVLLGLLILIVGFFIGRFTIDSKPEIKYVKGKLVHDTIEIENTDLVSSYSPIKPRLPTKKDTINLPGKDSIVIEKVDTAKIIEEYIKENYYKKVLFNDSIKGELIVGALVQYNNLQRLDYNYTPIKEVRKIQSKNLFTPFVRASYNTLNYFDFGIGSYINNFGLDIGYITDMKLKGFSLGVNYKF